MDTTVGIYIGVCMFMLCCSLAFFLIAEALTTWRNGKIYRMWSIIEMNEKGKNDND